MPQYYIFGWLVKSTEEMKGINYCVYNGTFMLGVINK